MWEKAAVHQGTPYSGIRRHYRRPFKAFHWLEEKFHASEAERYAERKQQGVQAVRDGQPHWRHRWGTLHRRLPKKEWNLDHGER